MSTASPAAGVPTTGDVSMAKKETASAPQDGESVRPNLVGHRFKGHSLWEWSPELKSNRQVRYLLPIPGEVWESKSCQQFCLFTV